MSRLTSRRLVATATAAILAVGVVATGASANAATDKPVTGGTLYFITHNEQFDHIDPTRIYVGQNIAFVNSYLYRALTNYKSVAGKDGNSLVADLATNTGVPSNKAKTWKFTLRSGVKWEDGSPITCADLKYGASRSFATDVLSDGPTYFISSLDIPTLADGSSAYKGPYKKTGQKYFDKAVTCSGNTITYNLKNSMADFNYFMSYPAASPVKQSKDTGDKYDLRPFASGPYKIASYKFGDQLELVRNPNWSKSTDAIRTPYPDNIVVRFGLAEDVRDQIMLEDQIPNTVNLDGLLPANNRTFFNDATKKNQRLNVVSPYVTYYALNVSKGKLDCLDVRKAIFFATNVQGLIDLAGGSEFYGTPADSPVSPALALDYKPTKGNIHDPNYKVGGNADYAKTFMEKAKTSCPDTYARATDPSKGLIYDYPSGATAAKGFVIVQDALKAAGIVIKANPIPGGVYYSTVMNAEKQGDITRSGWAPDWANASTVIPELFLKGHGFNLTRAENDPVYPAFEKKALAAVAETNRIKQGQMWQELSQVAMDQVWIFRAVFAKSQLQWGSKVGGVFYWQPQGTFGFGSLYVKN
jgi:peptide/nickel transport system substrate-binding protein